MTELLGEFDLKVWLVVLGPVLITAILMHGYWRMRRNRNTLKMALDKSFLSEAGEESDTEADFTMLRELPNGGARVRTKIEPGDDPLLNLDQDVPVLTEPVDNPQQIDLSESVNSPEPINSPEQIDNPGFSINTEADSHIVPAPSELDLDGEVTAARKEPKIGLDPEPPIEIPEKFVIVHVLSTGKPFKGQVLLEALVEQQMAFGEMDIFHRLDDQNDPKFSLVNAVEPGIFDLNTIGEIVTPGVTMFMRAHEVADPSCVYDDMINVAQTLAEELGGEVKDETRSAMTTQTIEHCRLDIRQYQYKYR